MCKVLKLIFITFVTNLACYSYATPIRIVTAEEPPNNYSENGEIKGIAVDIVKAIIEEAKIEATHNIYPWKRSFEMLKNEKNIGVYSTTRTPERENLFQWVGPLVGKTFGLFQNKDARYSAKSINDVKKSYLVLAQLASWQHEYLKTHQFRNISTHQRHLKMAQLIKHHRADYWFVGDLDMIVAANDNNILPLTYKLVFPIKSGENYIAFSKDVPKETISALQTALRTISESGKMKEIAAKWTNVLGMELISSERGIIVNND